MKSLETGRPISLTDIINEMSKAIKLEWVLNTFEKKNRNRKILE